MKPIRLFSAYLTVGGWTMASRILGFVRDIFIAAFLGAGPVAEAFLIAFTLPNMFRRFFAEGAFNMAFIPIFSKKLETDDKSTAFAQEALSGLVWVLIALSIVAHFAMPWLVLALASGFQGTEKLDLAVQYGRIAFPYIIFISLAALFSGILNALGKFAAAAAAPVLLNVVFIGALMIASVSGAPVGLTLAWAVPIAGVAQLSLVWFAAKRAGISIRPRVPTFSPDMRRLTFIALPAMLAGGVVQINLIVGRQVASFTEGAIAWLSYADRLYQLPLGVVGIAIGVVLLPELSRRLAQGDAVNGRAALNRATEWALALTLPAAAALIVIPAPLISVIFERAAFGAEDTAATAAALALYGLGLPAFVLQKTLQPAFFANEDTRRPFKYALVAMIVNAGIAIGLMPHIGFLAAAIGTSISAWIMVGLLWRGSRSYGDVVRIDDRLATRLPRIIASTIAMAVLLFGLKFALSDMLTLPGLRYLALAILIGAGIAAYAICGQILGAFSFSELKRELRRPPAAQ